MRADAVRLQQGRRNLISNAIKLTDQGSITVRYRVLDEWVRIEVEDVGIGIAPGEKASLSHTFERIGDRQGQMQPGTGLCLAISRRLVESMAGLSEQEAPSCARIGGHR